VLKFPLRIYYPYSYKPFRRCLLKVFKHGIFDAILEGFALFFLVAILHHRLCKLSATFAVILHQSNGALIVLLIC